MLKQIMSECVPFKSSVIVILVANPVDAVTLLAQEYSGLPRSQVFGSGTFLDSSRLVTWVDLGHMPFQNPCLSSVEDPCPGSRHFTLIQVCASNLGKSDQHR
jgi:lactate/malate dehydrogenase, NAD binding domain